jgi:nucleoside-diphosphate-sugar epimerase
MKVLVTGGGGFLGLAIVRRLLNRGDSIRSFSRTMHPELTALEVQQIEGNLADANAVAQAVQSCDLVFHVAAKAGVWGRYSEYYQTNYIGTVNVLAACVRNGIRRCVYTSSPSVVFTGCEHGAINEDAPYARRFLAHYPRTKAMAEDFALEANGADLATVSLRPHLIWGPGDHHLIPRLIDRARNGKLKRIGDGANLVDTTYIDNAADAHILAADRLEIGSPIAGKAYFISNDEPVNLWGFIDRILVAAGVGPVKGRMPASVAYAAGAILETLYRILPINGEPPMTRFVAKQLSTSHCFDLSAARRDLGYHPAVSIDEGIRRLTEYLATGSPGGASAASH